MESVEQNRERSVIEPVIEPAIDEQFVSSEPFKMMELPEQTELNKEQFEKAHRQSENKMYRAYNIELNNEINTKVEVLEKEIEEMRQNYEQKLEAENKGK